jgi:hypothetical protein
VVVRARDDNPIPAAGLPMTTDRMRWCLDIIGWPQRDTARQLRSTNRPIRKMARDTSATPIPWASGAKRPLSSKFKTAQQWTEKTRLSPTFLLNLIEFFIHNYAIYLSHLPTSQKIH